MHLALGFFGGAGGVEGDEAGEQLLLGGGLGVGLVGQRGGGAGQADGLPGEVGPAVGGKDGAVELVVQGAQHRDEALLVERLSLAPRGSPLRSFSSTLYMPVRVSPAWAACWRLRWASICSAESWRMASAWAGVGAGKGKVSK